MKQEDTIEIGVYKWSRRELSQIIRRRMVAQETTNKKRYSRKHKHKGADAHAKHY